MVTDFNPLIKCPFLDLRQIEDICMQELQALDLYPSQPGPINVEKFIKLKFGIEQDYEVLPEGILGFTEFGPKGVKRIVIARALAEEGSTVSERRVSTTLAHEAGHGLLHARLFLNTIGQKDIFGENVKPSPALCRKGDVTGVSSGGLRKKYVPSEFQANRAMSAILLPRQLVQRAVSHLCYEVGFFGGKDLEPENRAEAIQIVSEIFNVNPVVADFRIKDIYPVPKHRQLAI